MPFIRNALCIVPTHSMIQQFVHFLQFVSYTNVYNATLLINVNLQVTSISKIASAGVILLWFVTSSMNWNRVAEPLVDSVVSRMLWKCSPFMVWCLVSSKRLLHLDYINQMITNSIMCLYMLHVYFMPNSEYVVCFLFLIFVLFLSPHSSLCVFFLYSHSDLFSD